MKGFGQTISNVHAMEKTILYSITVEPNSADVFSEASASKDVRESRLCTKLFCLQTTVLGSERMVIITI